MKLHSFRYPALLAVAASILPFAAHAQTTLEAFIIRIQSTASLVIGLLFVLATLVFLWGVIKFIISAGDEAKRKAAKGYMTWGIVGLAVMAAAWGVVKILIEYAGVNTGATYIRYPTAF